MSRRIQIILLDRRINSSIDRELKQHILSILAWQAAEALILVL